MNFVPSRRKLRVMEAWAAAWEGGDMTALDRMLSPDYRRHIRLSPEGQNRDDLVAMITSTRIAFPDFQATIDDAVEEGDCIALRWHATGTHLGHLLGVPPTRKSVAVSGIDFTRFDGELIAEEWVTWDPGELLAALGVMWLGQT